MAQPLLGNTALHKIVMTNKITKEIEFYYNFYKPATLVSFLCGFTAFFA